MPYKFDIQLTDKDYLDYNTFWMTKSPYGKKQLNSLRIMVAVVLLLFGLAMLVTDGFSLSTLFKIIPLIIVLIVFECCLPLFLKQTLKAQLKGMKKSGKMGYSPEAVVEFLDDRLVETTPVNKTEHYYSAIERVSVINGKIIYIHINNVMAYLLPIGCFESLQQYVTFIEFLKEMNLNIDFYEGIL